MLLYQEIHPNHNLLICYTKSNAKNAILKFEDCVEPATLFIYLHSTRNLHAHHYMQIFTNTLIHSKLRNTLLYVENTRQKEVHQEQKHGCLILDQVTTVENLRSEIYHILEIGLRSNNGGKWDNKGISPSKHFQERKRVRAQIQQQPRRSESVLVCKSSCFTYLRDQS